MGSFGEGEGERLSLQYPKPLPMRLDLWLVAQRPKQNRARIQKFIEAGYVLVNGVTGRAQTPLRPGDQVQLWMPPPKPLPYLVAQPIPLDVLFEARWCCSFWRVWPLRGAVGLLVGMALHPEVCR